MDALETLKCAQINFDNLVKLHPAIKDIPFYQIAKMQLDDGIKKLETDEIFSYPPR